MAATCCRNSISNDPFRSIATGIFLFSLFFFTAAGCSGQEEDDRARFKLLLDAINDSFWSAELTPSGLGHLLSADLKRIDGTEYWYLEAESPPIRISAKSGGEQFTLTELEIHPAGKAGITLKDLEEVYGSWTLVYTSKTSVVRFEHGDDGGARRHVFVELLLPPDGDSPVLEITMSR